MLADSPHAFGDALAEAEGWNDHQWQIQTASRTMPDSLLLAAVDEQRWVGTMGARHYLTPTPGIWLVDVYLSPLHRGSGLASELLAEVERWAEQREALQLFLDVHEQAHAARAFYRRHGFAETGQTKPYVLDAAQHEIEMVKQL